MKKIKILYCNRGGAGVYYYRTLTPATELDKSFSNEFDVEIIKEIDFSVDYMEYLKKFDIIHYYRELHPDTATTLKIAKELRKNNTKLIMDIDDYWELPKTHPKYSISLENNSKRKTIENLKIADYVTTTTEYFANEIKKITQKDNVLVFENSINPDWMNQFQDNRKKSEDSRIRITYMGGSSHLADIEQLRYVFNILNSDNATKDKFKIILAGWDMLGIITDVKFNEEFGKELIELKLWNNDMVKHINSSKGDINKIPNLPKYIVEKYRNNIFSIRERPAKAAESVYYDYERILTDEHRIIEDKSYVNWLLNFERSEKHNNEGNYGRRWTQPANKYAKVLNETDIVLAPLTDNQFNRCKSNLKQVEVWSRKLPIVCSDVIPYNVDGKHMENCILIPNKKNAHKYWARYLRRLILEPELRTKLGNQLYVDFKDKYNLKNVTEKRAKFYEEINNK